MSNKCQNEGVHVYLNGNKDPAPIEITRTIKIDKPKPPPPPPPPPPGLKIWQIVLFIYVALLLLAMLQGGISTPPSACPPEAPNCQLPPLLPPRPCPPDVPAC